MEFPYFKYNPDPFKLGVVAEREIICSVCNGNCNFVYTGSFYSIEKPNSICINCVFDGSASKKFNAEFISDYEIISNKKAFDELLHKTPSYSSWQGQYWLSHCNDYCAIIDYVKWKDIEHLEEELSVDLENLSQEYGVDIETFKDYLDGGIDGYLFKCIHCGIHRLHADCS